MAGSCRNRWRNFARSQRSSVPQAPRARADACDGAAGIKPRREFPRNTSPMRSAGMSVASTHFPCSINSLRSTPSRTPADSGGVTRPDPLRTKMLVRLASADFAALIEKNHFVAAGKLCEPGLFVIVEGAPVGFVAQQLVRAVHVMRRDRIAPLRRRSSDRARRTVEVAILGERQSHTQNVARPCHASLERPLRTRTIKRQPQRLCRALHPIQMPLQADKAVLEAQRFDQSDRRADIFEIARLEQTFGIFGRRR